MSRNLLFAISALLFSLVFLSPSPAQGLRPPPVEAQPSAERRLEVLQKEVEALSKELERLRNIERLAQPAPGEKTDTRAFALKFSKAPEIAKVLQELFGAGEKRLRLAVDEKANKIVATGSAIDLTTVQALLTKLDQAPEQPKSVEKTSWKIFSLKRAEALDMAALLTKLFSREQVRLAADPRSNSLVVFAPSDDLMTIEAILSRLDEATEKKADTRPTPSRNP